MNEAPTFMMYEQVDSTAQTARLEDYLRSIKAHWLPILVTTLLGLGLAAWYTNQRTETYEAHTAVALNPTPVGSTNAGMTAPSVERESEFLASRAVAEAVIASLNLDVTPAGLLNDVNVQFVPNSDVLQVTARAASPEAAADLANAMVEEYSNQREAQAAAFNADALAVRTDQLSALQADITATETQLNELISQRAAATVNTPEAAAALHGALRSGRRASPQRGC